jgi:REP element-mobilizing transposase RayT
MPALKRFVLDGTCYHTISVTRERRPFFSNSENAQILVEAISFVRGFDKAYILAFVIMPDHMHLLLASKGEGTVSNVMKCIKNYAATID